MPGTEKDWIRKLNKRKALIDVYNCGMANPYVGGIPDRYYEGSKKHVWIEFKHIKKDTLQFDARTRITGNQREWLTRNYRHGHYPHVIVGVGLTHGFILDRPRDWDWIWFPDINVHQYKEIMMPIDDIAIYIERFVNGTRK